MITVPIWFLLLAFLGASASVLVGVLAGVSITLAVRQSKSPTQALTERITSAFGKHAKEEPEKPKTIHPPAIKP
jgi:hypothetical protein